MNSTTEFQEIPLTVEKDFLQRISSTGPVKALAELIWNGLDSGSPSVEVEFTKNRLGEIDEIRVIDKGEGISHDEAPSLFGKLGDSWKKQMGRKHGRALHGKNGQGRLHAFSLGNQVVWHTNYSKDGNVFGYKLSGNASGLTQMRATSPDSAKSSETGTTVVVSAISASLGALTSDHANTEFTKLFAPYLSQYPNVTIRIDGLVLDPASIQLRREDRFVSDIKLQDGKQIEAMVTIVEWAIPTPRAIHLCDKAGISLHETDAKIHAPGFKFTTYVRCDHFRELDKENLLTLEELRPDVGLILDRARDEMRGYFRKRAAERAQTLVQRWKEEEIYPYEDKEEISPVEDTERQVFDILGVTIEEYLPKFGTADHDARRFVFRLVAQALRDNPRSVQKIITDVFSLKKEEQDELANLLEETPLSNVIRTANTVANRLNFLKALEDLLFDKATKRRLLERDQLHKILENEAWVFDDSFALAGSEETLEEVLQIHLGELGKREDFDEQGQPVLRENSEQGRIDLMMSRTIQPRDDEYDHLVVELKRPSQKITSKILGQVESYAIAVAADPRFHKGNTRWKFIAVSNNFDEHARLKAQQREKPRGLVFDNGEMNITVWAFTWTEIIANARAKLQFINKSLNYSATRESARAYLERVHAKFVPQTDSPAAD
ncbi:MAG: ATP-binding protein [Luteolibacter sp.]